MDLFSNRERFFSVALFHRGLFFRTPCSYDADLRKGVPFLALVDIAAHLGDQIAPNPIFGGEEAFSSQTRQILKCSYYKNYCIDHNQILHSDRDPQVLTAGGQNLPETNPGWRTAAILKNRKILITSQRIDRF